MYFEEYEQKTVKKGLTKEEAITHCKDPETSSSTCTSSVGKERTKRVGAWFDAFTNE
jgi:hypothetical protein